MLFLQPPRCAGPGRRGPDTIDGGALVLILRGDWENGRRGGQVVNHPSPGRMGEAEFAGPFSGMHDCYRMLPKKRIRIKDAKAEIQRTWLHWDGDKSGNMAMLAFFGWLQRHRPYFLTFRVKGDPWQRVHGWLHEVERERREVSQHGR